MYGRTATFKFELDKRAMTHLKERSSYNHNYYELDLNTYGDYIIAEKCNILYEERSDDDFEAYYSLGYFEGDKFQAMFTWLDECKHLDFIMEG
jgi:hypothetical protein